MAIYKRDLVDINLETGNIHRSWLKHSIGYKDQKADHFGVRTYRDGTPVDLTGVSVQGVFLPPQGDPIAITSGNIVSGNVAEVVLPQACYNYDGQFTLAIKLVDSNNNVTGTVRIVDGMVDNTHASGTVAPTSAVPTYQEILSTYDAMIAATAAANGAIAATYSSSSTYAVGDYCIHDGGLYRCTTAINSGEAWTAAHWTAAKIGPDLATEAATRAAADSDLKSACIYEHTRINSSTDLNDLKTRGTYYWNASSVPSNVPDASEQTTLIVIEALETVCVTQITYNKTNMYWRRYQSSAWTSWVQVALDSDLYLKLAGIAQEIIGLHSDKPDTPYTPVYSLIEKKRNKTNLTTDNNNNHSITTLIPVLPGEMITAVTTTSATDTAIITVYNKNKTAESYVNSGSSSSNTYLISYLNSNAELKYVSVCGLSANDITVKGYAPVKQFGNLLLRKQGLFYKLDNTVVKVRFDSSWHVADYVCSTPIKLNEGDTIHMYARASTSIPAIIKCDQYGGNITFVVNGNNVTQYDYTAKEDCWVMVQYKESDTFNIVTVIPKAHRWNYNGDKNDTRHATVCFTYDDGTEHDADLVGIFDSYGLKCGFALPSSIVTDARCGEYIGYQNRGFSILSHSTSLSDGSSIFNNPDTSVETIKSRLLQSKQQLMRSGFDIRGWVTPQSQMYSGFVQYLYKLYDYGYTIYYAGANNDGRYVPGGSRPENRFNDSPYELWRITQYTLTDNLKAAVDECIANNGFLTIYFHAADLTDAHIERLETVLAYVNEKIATYNLKCLAPNEAFDYYFSVRKQDLS